MFIYDIILHKIFILLYYLAHKGLDWLKKIMASYCYITKTTTHNFT